MGTIHHVGATTELKFQGWVRLIRQGGSEWHLGRAILHAKARSWKETGPSKELKQ